MGMVYIPVITISCTESIRVDEVLSIAHDVHLERQKRIPSPDLNRFLTQIYEQHPPPAVQGKRIRILYGTQVGTAPPRFAFFSNHPKLIKKEYIRFLENRMRDQFGFDGVPLALTFKKKR
jgi:GTP-binding protein